MSLQPLGNPCPQSAPHLYDCTAENKFKHSSLLGKMLRSNQWSNSEMCCVAFMLSALGLRFARNEWCKWNIPNGFEARQTEAWIFIFICLFKCTGIENDTNKHGLPKEMKHKKSKLITQNNIFTPRLSCHRMRHRSAANWSEARLVRINLASNINLVQRQQLYLRKGCLG